MELKVDQHITFKESDHSYTNTRDKIKYISCTTLIGKYFNKFVADENKTRKTCAKLNLTHEEVLQLWEDKKNASCDRGSEIHLALELIFSDLATSVAEPKFVDRSEYYSYCRYGWDKWNSLVEEGYTFLPEELLWHDPSQLAGQADLPIVNHKTKEIILADYKTNDKVLSYDNFFDPSMLAPFEGEPCGELSKYGIQLAMYALMLEHKYKGYKVISAIVLHLRNGKCDEIIIDLPKYKKIAKKMIKIRHAEIKATSQKS